MSELPPPDVMDQSGRARRLVLALLVGAAAAAGAFAVASALADGSDNRYSWTGGPTKFIWYMTAFFGAAAFSLTLAIANARAKKKWREGLVAKARVVE